MFFPRKAYMSHVGPTFRIPNRDNWNSKWLYGRKRYPGRNLQSQTLDIYPEPLNHHRAYPTDTVRAPANHGNIKWDTLQTTGVEDSTFLCLVQDNFLTQHVLEPTRAARVLDLVLSSQKEFVDNVVIQEPLGSSDHNQLHFNIKIKSDKTKVKQCRRDFRKGNYKEMRKRLAHIASMIFCGPGRVRAWNLQARAGPGLVNNNFAGCRPGLGLTFPGLGRAGPTVKVTLVLT